MLKPVSKDTKIKEITIPARSSTTEIANILKDNNLIKDVNIFKLYLKINKINNLKASVYQLSENMGVKKITEISVTVFCHNRMEKAREIQKIDKTITIASKNTKPKFSPILANIISV